VGEIVDDTTIRLVDSVDADTFIKADTRVYANVVLAGHGEGEPEKILGSGDAMLFNQSFTLEVEGVAFTADATKSSGVAAAMDVSVDGQIWEQVSTLKDSAPGDHHYAIRMTEDGYVKILFGDGEYGRRLPSGKNNIRVRYRVGSGLNGNVPAGGLEKPVNPHPLIETVHQPLPAAGGGDMEDMASLRENAPSTLLALERAVSLSDFSHLAASQSSVWQAKAYSQILHGGRMESVKVVIVPAAGVHSPEVNKTIQSFLQKHSLPGVQVTVDPCVQERFNLLITVRVKTDEFVSEEVEKAVALALVDHFSLKNRKLGEHLYLSEVYKIIESIQGVENSICVLNNDKTLQLVRADNESKVLYLDTNADENPSELTVTSEEYQP
jgi:predicted phage baseplate assembly protein